MAKVKKMFVCQSCGFNTAKWLGKCPECGQWNSFLEEEQGKAAQVVGQGSSYPKRLSEVSEVSYQRFVTDLNEFDRVVGGGITRGSLSLIGGEPGIGKSTLLMEVCGRLLSKDQVDKILYVSGEESESQIADRSKRMGISSDNFLIYHQNSWEKIKSAIKEEKPSFLVIDSIQTTVTEQLDSAAGTLSQIREVTYELMNVAKASGITTMVIGHVTKEGNIAGPKVLEHMVDTVVYFEGDQWGQYRILRAIKNRFGNTNEVGIFEMADNGLNEVRDPSSYFLDENMEDSYGRSISCIVEGTRAIFVELQALVVENKFGNGRRTAQGVDNNRVALLVAVIDKYFDIPISYNDIYVNVVGGLKITSRETDLSIIASLLSSYKGVSLPSDTVFLGEVGLTGEVRSVPQMEIRIKEIAQMNYRRVITTVKTANELGDKFDLELIGIKKATDLDKVVFL